jgi:hypothetical protein
MNKYYNFCLFCGLNFQLYTKTFIRAFHIFFYIPFLKLKKKNERLCMHQKQSMFVFENK